MGKKLKLNFQVLSPLGKRGGAISLGKQVFECLTRQYME